MGRIILLILLFISFVSFGQTNSAKYSRDADTAQMIIQTTKSGGIVKYLLITGTDTAQIRWDGTALLIEGYNIVDSTNLQTDTLQALRIDINKNIDSLALHLDTLQDHRTDINAKVDSTNIRLYNTGNSVFIGEGVGADDDLTNNLNVFIGYQSGKVNTTGHQNIGIGAYSLIKNTTGQQNVGIGDHSLFTNVTGNQNTALGDDALYFTRGDSNIAIGYESARFIADGISPLFDATNCTYIGTSLLASGDGIINEIGIGANVICNGPDTFTAGDDNVTDVYMNENGTAIVHAGEYILTTDFKIIIFNDTMCGVKISTTDTVRIVPTR